MKEKQSSNFAIGFVIGLLLCMILWYWQKSTAAEDGALALLDRFAAKDAQLRRAQQAKTEMPASIQVPVSPPAAASATAVDLQEVKGVGPTFAGRLRAAGIETPAQLAALEVAKVAEILKISHNRGEGILEEAKKLLS